MWAPGRCRIYSQSTDQVVKAKSVTLYPTLVNPQGDLSCDVILSSRP